MVRLARLLLVLLLASVVLGTGLGSTLEAQTYLTPQPSPFRNDELDGRDFEYNEESFLHRFSYRFRPAAVRRWYDGGGEGFRGLAGSTRSDEFYVVGEALKTVTLDGPLRPDYFNFRYQREEDFDSRYDRALIGTGLKLPQYWYVTVLGELEGDKEDIDIYVEAAWANEQGNGFRADFVFVDATFNDKADDGEYETQPFTYFLEGRWKWLNGISTHAWINYNSPLRREYFDRGFDFTYNQVTASMAVNVPLSDAWSVNCMVAGGNGDRDKRTFDPADPQESRLSRYNFETTLEFNRVLSDELELWFGARYFRLSERDRRPRDAFNESRLRRREHMVFGGVSWRFHERAVFWPGIYLDFIDNNEDFPNDPLRQDEDEDFVGKLALPVELWLTEAATITVNPTVFLHKAKFGGGLVQVQVPF